MRTKPTQLPRRKELENILETESKREIAEDKKDIHYPDFSLINNLFKKLNIDFKYFDDDIYIENIDDKFIEKIDNLIEGIVNEILKNQSEEYVEMYDQIYDYLSEEDTPQKSDFIFVFGSKLNLRIDKAIELYNQGLGDKIIISGGKPIYEGKQVSEAENLKNHAVSKGILESDLIIENKSISIPDNIKSSLNLLEEKGIAYSSFITINSPFAQRRGWSHFQKFTPKGIKIYRVNSDSFKVSKDSWYKEKETIQIILNEFIKMKLAIAFNSA